MDKNGVLIIDDLHMTMKDSSKNQPSLELIR